MSDFQKLIDDAVRTAVAHEATRIQDFWFNRYAQLEKELLKLKDYVKQALEPVIRAKGELPHEAISALAAADTRQTTFFYPDSTEADHE